MSTRLYRIHYSDDCFWSDGGVHTMTLRAVCKEHARERFWETCEIMADFDWKIERVELVRK